MTELVIKAVADCYDVDMSQPVSDGKGGWKPDSIRVEVGTYDLKVGTKYISNVCSDGLQDLFDVRDGTSDKSEIRIIVSTEQPVDDDSYYTLAYKAESEEYLGWGTDNHERYDLADVASKGNLHPWDLSVDQALTAKFKKAPTLYVWAEDVPA